MTPEPSGERLQKVLARAGIGSRRVCEDLIAEGRVTVNGAVAVLGRRVDPQGDEVEVDGALVAVAEGLVHYLLNKPAGVVSTASDPQGRPTVVGLVPLSPRVFPVGRLDIDTEGLMIVTNDGPLAHRLTHPRFGVEKEYMASVEGRPAPGVVRTLRQGVALEDGTTSAARVALVSPSVLRITIHEGRNRQVRRMCEAVGHPVIRLVRIRVGPIADRRLPPGEWRPLSPDEIRALGRAAGATGPSPTANARDALALGSVDTLRLTHRHLDVACSLDGADVAGRLADWRRLGSMAVAPTEELGGGVRLWLPLAAADDAAELAEEEARCCGFLDVELAQEGGRLRLDVTSPAPDAQAVIAALTSPGPVP